MEKKSDVVRRLVAAGDYRKALSYAKDFRLGITKEQHEKMLRGYECMMHPAFYSQIGIDPRQAVADGVSVLKAIYG